MGMDATIVGLDDLHAGYADEVAQLEFRLAKRGLRLSTYAGAAVARDVIRANAPKVSGELQHDLAAASADAGPGTIAAAGVKVKAPRKKYSNTKLNRRKGRVGKPYEGASPSYYWRFVELGSSHARAHPFVRPAFDANVGLIGDAVGQRLGRFLDEEKG